jgi:hypothetical protein
LCSNANYYFISFDLHDIGIEHLRLKEQGHGISDEEFFKKHPAYNDRVLSGLMSILELFGCTGDPTFNEELYDPGEVITIIRTTNLNAFESFCVLCLKHIVGNASWRQNFRRDTISSVFTISDEAFAFLVLDNNREYWRLCYEKGEHNIPVAESTSASGRSHKRRKIETRYTKRGSEGGKQGWTQDGIDAYNDLLKVVINNRNKAESKDLEGRLKRQWNTDRMDQLQKAGRVVNEYDGIMERTDEQDADIVDSW